MSNMEACSTCARILSDVSLSAATEKPHAPRQVECCGRWICGSCIYTNPRFGSYCPYCQVSSSWSSTSRVADLHNARHPPPYTPSTDEASPPPPPYQNTPPPESLIPEFDLPSPSRPDATAPSDPEKAALVAAAGASSLATSTRKTATASPYPVDGPPAATVDDVLHFLDHAQDSITSLSLAYGVPAAALRRANKLATDELLFARRTIVIPGSYLAAASSSSSADPTGNNTRSLRPRPVEGEEEERRKSRIRRWMLACREPDYDLALLYLDAAGYDVEVAVARYRDDERWERENPMRTSQSRGKGSASKRIGTLNPPRR